MCHVHMRDANDPKQGSKEDQRSGQPYFLVRISMTADEITRLNGLKLVPGMPVEAFIQTGSRTALSYLLKPFEDQVMRAFRER